MIPDFAPPGRCALPLTTPKRRSSAARIEDLHGDALERHHVVLTVGALDELSERNIADAVPLVSLVQAVGVVTTAVADVAVQESLPLGDVEPDAPGWVNFQSAAVPVELVAVAGVVESLGVVHHVAIGVLFVELHEDVARGVEPAGVGLGAHLGELGLRVRRLPEAEHGAEDQREEHQTGAADAADHGTSPELVGT